MAASAEAALQDAYTCPMRFYEPDMPKIGDVVIVRVVEVTDTAAYVQLLEYENRLGMIPFQELSRRRIRSISKHAKVGKQETVTVIRLDAQKNYIDLSKKEVTQEEKKRAEERFQNAKIVMGMMRHVAAESKVPLLELMQKVAWPLYRTHDHAFNGLKRAYNSETNDANEEVLAPLNLPVTVVAPLLTAIRNKMKALTIHFRAEVEVTCYSERGIDGVKDSLLAGIAVAKLPPAIPMTITVVAPPKYLILAQCESREAGLQKLTECIRAIKAAIENEGGEITVTEGPSAGGHFDALAEQAGRATAEAEDGSSEDD